MYIIDPSLHYPAISTKTIIDFLSFLETRKKSLIRQQSLHLQQVSKFLFGSKMTVQVLSPLQYCLKNFPTLPHTPVSPLMIYRPKPSPSNQAIQAQPNFRKQQKPSRTNNTNSQPAKNQLKIKKRGGEPIKPAALAPQVNRPSPHQKIQELRFYAGSCTSSASPPPSSLPVPLFLAKT